MITENKNYRQNGVYYTNEDIILMVINPLFLDELKDEFEKSKNDISSLRKLHEKVGSLKFLEPACGCGNFLHVTYSHLCDLEKDIIKCFKEKNLEFNFKVSANQFYGIEIEKEACIKAVEGMEKVHKLTSEYYKKILKEDVLKRRPFLPPKIVNENALRIDWDEIVSKKELNYIMGNPPFVGYFKKSPEQRKDMELVFGKKVKHGQLDYVCAWFKKAAEFMEGTKIEAAFVSTSSIAQGQQPAILWEPLVKQNNTIITFAHRTFKWGNDAIGKKAQVHCVIIGFSDYKNDKEKKIFDENSLSIANNINPYLVDAKDVILSAREHPICNVSEMIYGSKPADGGFLLLSEEEKEELIKENRLAQKWIRPFLGSREFITGEKRWCLWLVDASPNELRKCKLIMDRIDNVRNFRLHSKAASTKKASNIPTLFKDIRQPSSNYLIIPEVSSEKRKYIPIGFMNKSVIASNAAHIIPNATLYHFRILISSVHMAWMRAVAGRLKSDYRYSSGIVYNNFIWPNPTPTQKENIEKAAQAVLDARKLYPDSTLADLYDPNTMPPELTKAHERLDKTVKAAYGNEGFETEEEIVASLMKLYKIVEATLLFCSKPKIVMQMSVQKNV